MTELTEQQQAAQEQAQQNGEAGAQATERWEPVGDGSYRCGDYRILATDDPTCVQLESMAGDTKLRIVLPDRHWNVELGRTVLGILEDTFANYEMNLPVQGLEGFAAEAEIRSVDYHEARQAEAERARLEELGKLIGQTFENVHLDPGTEVEFFVPGAVAKGGSTLLHAHWRVGKNDLIMYLLSKLERGEETVFGPAYGRPVTATCLIAEPPPALKEKVERFEPKLGWSIYQHQLSGMTWAQQWAYLVKCATLRGDEIIFIDDISRATGIESESDVDLARATEPFLSECIRVGITVILLMHQKKGRSSKRDAHRGTTALPAACNIVIGMFKDGGPKSHKRQLHSEGHYRSTFWTRGIEQNEAGTDYTAYEVADAEDDGNEQREAAERMSDHFKLSGMGSATVAEFALMIGKSRDTARGRLNQLVKAGKASKKRDGKADVYRPRVSTDESAD